MNWFQVTVAGVDIPVEADRYPDGSFAVRCLVPEDLKIPGRRQPATVTMKSTLPAAIVALAQLKMALELQNVVIDELHIQTFPDQRADRVTKPGESIPAIVSAQLIAGITQDANIHIYDPHSRVIVEALNEERQFSEGGIVIHDPLQCFQKAMGQTQPSGHVVAVDHGAVARAEQVATHYDLGVIYCDKQRVEGKVVGHEISRVGRTVIENIRTGYSDDIWIVDDLCDGGATFISVAKLLIARFPTCKLHLYVTHGLFSRGKDELFKYFATIHSLFDYSREG